MSSVVRIAALLVALLTSAGLVRSPGSDAAPQSGPHGSAHASCNRPGAPRCAESLHEVTATGTRHGKRSVDEAPTCDGVCVESDEDSQPKGVCAVSLGSAAPAQASRLPTTGPPRPDARTALIATTQLLL